MTDVKVWTKVIRADRDDIKKYIITSVDIDDDDDDDEDYSDEEWED